MSADVPFHDPEDGSTAQPQGFDPVQLTELQQVFADLQFRTQHSEPVVRDFNRHFIDLLGQCPNTPCGNWLTLHEDGTVQLHIDLVDVIRLSTALRTIAEDVELGDVRRKLPKKGATLAYLQSTVRQDSLLKHSDGQFAVKSVHLKPAKGRGLFRKGR